jgi:hypothetical protein
VSTGTTTQFFTLDCFALLASKLAHLGNRVVGLDPDYTAANVARQRCAGFGNVEIRQTGFLEAILNDDAFSIGVSSRRTTTATGRRALHSRSPATRYARGLRMGHIPNGKSTHHWNTPARILSARHSEGALRPFVRRSEGVGKRGTSWLRREARTVLPIYAAVDATEVTHRALGASLDANYACHLMDRGQ